MLTYLWCVRDRWWYTVSLLAMALWLIMLRITLVLVSLWVAGLGIPLRVPSLSLLGVAPLSRGIALWGLGIAPLARITLTTLRWVPLSSVWIALTCWIPRALLRITLWYLRVPWTTARLRCWVSHGGEPWHWHRVPKRLWGCVAKSNIMEVLLLWVSLALEGNENDNQFIVYLTIVYLNKFKSFIIGIFFGVLNLYPCWWNHALLFIHSTDTNIIIITLIFYTQPWLKLMRPTFEMFFKLHKV